ncbi:RIO kinase 1 [Pancytospora epiphaga]|nr:RIO kinase 1 [Pancytospora epiphaga]
MDKCKEEKRRKDKSDHATADKVLDPNTLSILTKLQKREKIFDLSGTISSGKEANIYTARCSTSLVSKFISTNVDEEKIVPVVLKIYKTSTMVFKDRERYIVDEKRFANFCRNNSRKLVKVWAEKEVRNLKRMEKYGIPCPKPMYLKKSILIMSMIGEEIPAPRLKDAAVDDWESVYKECIMLLEQLYQKAGLVHADFSEYNLIYHNKRVFVIDVGQSIEKSQDNSNMFLLMDIRNCNDFFERKGVSINSDVEVFERITGLKIPHYLKRDGKLSKDTFIPTRITEVANMEDYALFIPDKPDINGNNSECRVESRSYETEDNEISNEESVSSNKEELDNPVVKIDVCLRRLRLKKPEITEDAEKGYNKERKRLVKEMNRDRRCTRSIKNEKIKVQKAKKAARSRDKQSNKNV